MPWPMMALNFLMKALRTWRDRGYSFSKDNRYVTRCKTKQEYIDIYAGDEYKICYKFSNIMLLVFISFAYGLLIPSLFFISLFGIFNVYVTDRILLAYYYP